MTEAEKQAALKLIDELAPERDLRDGGQGASYPTFRERAEERSRIRASGEGGPVGGPIGRGFEY